MRNEIALRISALIAVAANVFGVIQFGAQYPLAYLPLAVLAAAIIFFIAQDRFLAYWRIKKILDKAEEIMRSEGFKPDLLVAFDRSSAIFTAMIAQRMALPEILVLPRRAYASAVTSQPRSIVIGENITINISRERLERTLIVVFHLRTGATLEAGLQSLMRTSGQFPGKILAIHASAGGIARWPGVVIVNRLKQGEVPNERLPWMSGKYVHT